MLDHHDTQAILGLVIKAVRLYDEEQEDQQLLEILNNRIQQSTAKQAQVRATLTVFGFEPKPDVNIWNDVREAVGPELYDAAVATAKMPPEPTASAGGQPLQLRSMTVAADEPAAGSQGGPEPEALPETATPKISDAVLECLIIAGEKGAKVGEVKSYLSLMYGIETHEKTPGMTLYRLSQQKPPLARREGRTWFFVPPPVVESKNPGAGTPGSEVDHLV